MLMFLHLNNKHSTRLCFFPILRIWFSKRCHRKSEAYLDPVKQLFATVINTPLQTIPVLTYAMSFPVSLTELATMKDYHRYVVWLTLKSHVTDTSCKCRAEKHKNNGSW